MAEKPILLNSDEIRAILDGEKTEIQIAMECQPKPLGNGWYEWGWKLYEVLIGEYSPMPKSCTWHHHTWMQTQGTAPIDKYCPYGHPGDIVKPPALNGVALRIKNVRVEANPWVWVVEFEAVRND